MKKVPLFLTFLFLGITVIRGQVPIQPTINGPDSICTLTTQKFYIDKIQGVTNVIWNNEWNGGMEYPYDPNRDTVLIAAGNTSGIFYLTARAVNINGEGPDDTLYIHILSIPDNLDSLSGKSSVCAGEGSVPYIAYKFGVPVQNCYWSLPPNSHIVSGGSTGSIIVSFDSVFAGGDISAKNKTGTCLSSASITKNIHVIEPFLNSLTITATTSAGDPLYSACYNDTIEFHANPSNPAEYYFRWELHGKSYKGQDLYTFKTNSYKIGRDTIFCHMKPLNITCSDIDTAEASLFFIHGKGRETIERKLNAYPNSNKLFLMCTSCDPYQNSYRWGKIKKEPFKDTCSECGNFDGKVFCVYETNSISDYTYYLEVSSNDNSDCYREYYPTDSSKAIIETSFMRIFPNPNDGHLNCELNSDYSGTVDVFVRDVIGNEMKRIRYDKTVQVENVPLELVGLNKGIYFIEAVLGNGERLISKTLVY